MQIQLQLIYILFNSPLEKIMLIYRPIKKTVEILSQHGFHPITNKLDCESPPLLCAK